MNYNLKNNAFINHNLDVNINPSSHLISKKIDTYFNELVQIPEPINNTTNTTNFSFGKFYDEYIEHNILLLFIIFCLVIF